MIFRWVSWPCILSSSMNGPDFTHRRIKMEPVDKAMHAASYSQMSSGPADKAMHAAKLSSGPADKHFIRRSGLIRRLICLPMIQYLSAGQRCLTRMRRSRSDEALAITQEGGGGRNDDDDDAEVALHCRNSAFRPTSSMVCMLRKLTHPVINLSPIFYCLGEPPSL